MNTDPIKSVLTTADREIAVVSDAYDGPDPEGNVRDALERARDHVQRAKASLACAAKQQRLAEIQDREQMKLFPAS